MAKNVAWAIGTACEALANCRKSGNVEWTGRWGRRISDLVTDCLPYGSGFDVRPSVDAERSGSSVIVVHGEFHAMDANGCYCGWHKFTVTVRPNFDGLDVRVKGGGDDLRDYIADCYASAMSAAAPEFCPV